MRINKQSNLTFGRQDENRHKITIDTDLSNLFRFASGRVRFGDGDTGTNGENISGQFVEFTSHAVADTEFSVAHTVGSIPKGYIVLWQDKAASLYQTPISGTDWTTSAVSLKCDVGSVTFKIFLIK